jgi:hypothetical protein
VNRAAIVADREESAMACRLPYVLLTFIASFACAQPAIAAEPMQWMVRLAVNGKEVEGSPISWSTNNIRLLGRDGRLWNVDINAKTDVEQTQSMFKSFLPSELRAALLREFGHDYEVSGTGHYLVAHPRGEGDKWSQRFEDLYRAFVHYFSVRGFKVNQPPFPLVGIVCKDRAEFAQHAAKQDQMGTGGILGYYNIDSNRIMLYDMGAKASSSAWQENANVLIHECTHQIAFNTGVHSRFAPPPRWVAEGLAMLFESPGVYDAHDYRQFNDRVNHGRLRDFKEAILPKHSPEMIVGFLSSDEWFQKNPGAAYAMAWALTFYLAENEPTKYAEYLKLTANRAPFTNYPGPARVKDFISVFGKDWRMLDARFARFYSELR